MKAILCLFLICLTAFAAAEAGLKLTITPKAIASFKDQFLPKIVAKLQNLQIPPITAGGLTVSNFTLSQLYLPSDSLNVQFSANRVYLSSANFGVQARFHIDYTLLGFIPLSATLDCATNKSAAAIGISIEDDHLLKLTHFEVKILNLDINFPESYFGPVYHGLIYILSWPLEYILSNVINSNVKTALQSTLDAAVAMVPGFIVLPFYPIGLDYQISNNPRITSNYMTIYINGTFYAYEHPFAVPPVAEPRDYPEFDTESGHHVQAFISEYVFNTALYTVFEKGQMKVNVTNDMIPPEAGLKFGTNWLKQFIPDINNYFNVSNNVSMGLNVTSNPLVTISKGAMNVVVITQIAFYYLDKDNVTEIIKLQSTLQVNANVTLTDWTMKPCITSAIFGNFTVINSNVGKVTGDRFQQGFNILLLIGTAGFNAQFKPIELPKVPGVSLEKSTVTYEEGHIRIQASPVYPQNQSLVLPIQHSLRTETI